MKTSEDILNEAAEKASQILGVPHKHLDNIKFIQMYSHLYTLMGGDEELMRHWLNNHNKHFGFCPAAELTNDTSLDKILGYLESFRDT